MRGDVAFGLEKIAIPTAAGLEGVTAPPMEISDDRLPVLFKS
jgi:hypothetical protein